MSKLEELAWETLAQIAPHADTDCDCFACEDGRKMIRSALLAFGEAVLERAAQEVQSEHLVDPTTDPLDECYDNAIRHALEAVRSINLGEL
jgi:hypothetical protein